MHAHSTLEISMRRASECSIIAGTMSSWMTMVCSRWLHIESMRVFWFPAFTTFSVCYSACLRFRAGFCFISCHRTIVCLSTRRRCDSKFDLTVHVQQVSDNRKWLKTDHHWNEARDPISTLYRPEWLGTQIIGRL